MIDNLPPIDHSQGFKPDEIRLYLAAFADRLDSDIASYDIWRRATTFGDMRKLVKEAQKTMSLFD